MDNKETGVQGNREETWQNNMNEVNKRNIGISGYKFVEQKDGGI